MGQEKQVATAPVAAPAAPAVAPKTKVALRRTFTDAYELKTRDGAQSSVSRQAAADSINSTALISAQIALQQAEAKKASEKAAALGLQSVRLPNGSWIGSATLTHGGSPIFVKSSNRTSAALIKTNQVWPAAAGGTVAPGVTGAGRSILMWDGGIGGVPLQTHPEFQLGGNSRITIPLGTTPEFHATAVAGTLAAAGLTTPDTPNADARGMAYEANVLAFDQDGDLTEIQSQTLAELQLRRVSNHSYGFDHGWTFLVDNSSVPATTFILWEGDIGISQAESQFYGLYTAGARTIDQQAYAKPYFQTVWAAGNQRFQGPDSNYFVRSFAGYGGYFYATFRFGVIGYTNAGTILQGSTVFIPQTGVNTFGAPVAVNNISPPVDGGATGFDTLSDKGVSKNALTVGSVDGARTLADVGSATAHGPTDDGRLKPDVVAKGVDIFTTEDSGSYTSISGTSFAAPAVASSANLVSFRYEDLWGNREPMRSSTLRGLIAHTADDVVVVNADPKLAIPAGPDYKTGWGTMDTAEAMTSVNANHAATYNGVRMRPFIKEVFLPDGSEIDFTVRATGGMPVKVTAAWTDPAGETQATNLLDPTASRLVNDLDLTVTRTVAGSAQIFKPWRLNPASPATAAIRIYPDSNMNSLDNIEVVETNTNATAAQIHRIRIKQKTGSTIRQVDPVTGTLVTGGQWVSITLSGVAQSNINFTITAQTFAFGAATVQATLTWNAVVGQIYRIQRSTNLVTWTENSGDIIPLREVVTATTLPAPSSGSGFYRVITVQPNPFNL
jgi:Subtilase family